jgi:putative ABC transport system permease protein
MILLRLLSWPYLRKHVLRWSLTVAGIVMGVGLLVAMHSANQAVLASFGTTVGRIAGAAELQISAGDFGFDEAVLDRVQAVPEVRVAVPVVEAVADTGIKGQGNLLILGVDMTGDRSLRDYDLESGDQAIIDDPLVFLAQPDSLMVAKEFAERNHLAIDSRIPLQTSQGTKSFTIRGIMRSGGLGRAFGGNLAVMDVYAAQKVFGRGRRFDRIDVGVKEGVRVEQCRAAIAAALGPGFDVAPPSAGREHFEAMLSAYSMSMNVSSMFALIIGMFIIYNSFAIAVTQRRAEIGILRALGATRAQVRMLFLGESAVAGTIGSLAGIGAGALMARGIALYVGGFTSRIYGVKQALDEVAIDPRIIVGGLLLGIATSLLAAWIPARSAARVDPVQALQKGKYQVLSAGEGSLRRRVAALSAVLSVGCLWLGRSNPVFYAGYALAVVTALLLAPMVALWVTRMIRPALRWLRPVEGALAADSLIQAPRRTSATVSALMLSIAMVVGFGGVSASIYLSVTEWMDTTLNPDLYVEGSEWLASYSWTLPGTAGAELERVEGVEQAQMVRSARTLYHGVPVMVVAVEVAKLAQKVHGKPIAGDAREMYRLTAAGQGAMISDSFAGLRGVGLGDTLELGTPSGMLRLPVVGIRRDFSDQQGTVLIDRSVYQRWWNDDRTNIIRVYLKPGADPAVVKGRILERFAGQRVFVLFNKEVRQYILQVTDQWFAMTYNQAGIAILIAVLGIVNTLTVSITDRRRELGVLQAVGGLRRQIRHTVWIEALSIGVVGLVLGLAFGALNLYYTLEMTRRTFAGIALDYSYPGPLVGLLALLVLGAALVAALGPAEQAVRGSLVEALEYE